MMIIMIMIIMVVVLIKMIMMVVMEIMIMMRSYVLATLDKDANDNHGDNVDDIGDNDNDDGIDIDVSTVSRFLHFFLTLSSLFLTYLHALLYFLRSAQLRLEFHLSSTQFFCRNSNTSRSVRPVLWFGVCFASLLLLFAAIGFF